MKSKKHLSTLTLLSLIVLTGCTNNNDPIASNKISSPIVPEGTVKTIPGDTTKTGELRYKSPAGDETVNISMSLNNGIITSVSATPLATNPKSIRMQTGFSANISQNVVGKALRGLKVDTVSGASLTTAAFNDFLTRSAN